jgi:hypothetical protein
VRTKDRSEAGFVEAFFGDGDQGVVELFDRLVRLNAIYGEKVERAQKRDALVAVDERLILRDVKRVGGRNRVEIGIAIKELVQR